jgi:hypothetical protein
MLYFFPVIIGCGSADVGFSGAASVEVDARVVLGTGGNAGRQLAGAGGKQNGTGGVVVITDAAADAVSWIGRACTGEGQCPAGQICLGMQCATFCRTDADCFAGYKCGAGGPKCPANDPACMTDALGASLVCLRECRSTADCMQRPDPAGCCLSFEGAAIAANCSERRMCAPYYDCPKPQECGP